MFKDWNDLQPIWGDPAQMSDDEKKVFSLFWREKEVKEVLLQTTTARFVLFPIKHIDIWHMYKKAESNFWTANEFVLDQDRVDWLTLKIGEQEFIKHVLAFFAASDGIVNENLCMKFCNEIQVQEVRAFYGFQMMMENIHNEVYSILIDSLVSDSEEKMVLFKAIEKIPAVKLKADWALQWINNENSFAERLLAFICVEGIFFSGSFCAIFWLKKRGLMPGLTFTNEKISQDEGLHTEFGILLYSKLQNPLPLPFAHNIIKNAVDIEQVFVKDALKCELIGMNSTMMITYIKYVADHICGMLHLPNIYNVKNPFDWMELISMQGKTNFFERRVAEYQRPVQENKFSLTESF